MKRFIPFLLLPTLALTTLANASDVDVEQRINRLEQELAELKTELTTSKAKQVEKEQLAQQAKVEEKASTDNTDGIRVGGAVRFQYSYEDYNEGNRDRSGDIDFDVFRLDLNGEIGDVILSAQYRWFQYMNVVHHAWVGYNLTPTWQVQAGVTRVPFGNLDYNSHNFFFSTNYYLDSQNNRHTLV
jgi:hypothetical protein